ncbi:MAG: hypothetical protein AAF297_07030 [Planctomycetota bacterium]
MSLANDTAQVVLQLQFVSGLSPSQQQTLQTEASAKITRMDPSSASADWTFPIGAQDPTMAEMIQKVTACLAELTGDENALAYAVLPSGSPYYCIFPTSIICYTPIKIRRTVASNDTLWGGDNGPGTPIAYSSGGLAFELEAVYAFARASQQA